MEEKLQDISVTLWKYDTDYTIGCSIGVENPLLPGYYDSFIDIERVKTKHGIVNRVVIRKDFMEKRGWTIVEE